MTATPAGATPAAVSFAASSDITLSMSEPMDIFGNDVDENGVSYDQHGKVVDISNYFVTRGELKADAQREAEYTRMLGKIVLERFKSANTVYSSHLVAFVAFELLKQRFSKADLYSVLRTPEEDREILYDDFYLAVNRAKEALYEMNNKSLLKLIGGNLTSKVIGHRFPQVLVVPWDYSIKMEKTSSPSR